MNKRTSTISFTILVLALFALALTPIGAGANGKFLELPAPVVPEDEKPSSHYDSILYAEIAPKLMEIAANSNRVKFEVIGQSAGGRDMYLVTLSDPKAMGRLGRFQAIRHLMLTDPEAAQEMIDRLGEFKVPVFINASIHGTEYPGVDAAIRLIETLAYDDSEEVQSILDSVILLVNVVANPDGRVLGTRANANGFDLNRDFITQSQPETRAMAKVISEWNPMVLLDLHGFINPMLIEPCTPLHNPNYEYDLYIKWAYYEAEAMEAELLAQTGFSAQIPFRDDDLGWDDWPPTYTPMYAMYHGAYGHTLETPFENERGVDAHYAAVWGALKFIQENRQEMIYDQIEIFRRGFLDLPQWLIPDELLNETQFEQYNDLTITEFPSAYIIPAKEPFQISDHQAARLVDFLLANDLQVERTTVAFTYNGVEYPPGTYIVWMNQPKRGLANTILESGIDLSVYEGITFYSPPSVWSNLLLWGARGVVVEDDLDVGTVAISAITPPEGSLEYQGAPAYAYLPVNLNAFRASNAILEDGGELYRSTAAFVDEGRSFGSGTLIIRDEQLALELVKEYDLDLYALSALPASAMPLQPARIAVLGDHGLAHALKTMGFDFDLINKSDLSTGAIMNYATLINMNTSFANIGSAGRSGFDDFVAAGGDYIGLGSSGSNFAIQAGLVEATTASGSGNAIVMLSYTSETSISSGFFQTDYAFVNTPVWFIGDELEVVASYAADDFLVSGFWPGWIESGAAGMPAIIHLASGASDVTLFGIDATFRGHPENTFRLLGNAIYSGLD